MRRAVLVPVLALLTLAGCDRAALRIPGAADDFGPATTGYVAPRAHPGTVTVELPSDKRGLHYGDKVAGTDWAGCRNDAMFATTAPFYVQREIERELAASKLFSGGEPHFVLKTEIDAFCAQVEGFVIQRVAGIMSLKFTLVRDGRTIWESRIEHVVTDADDAYTGSQVTTIQQAMRTTETDSLRAVLRNLLGQLQNGDIELPLADARH